LLDRLAEIRKEIAALLEEGWPLTDERILELSHELDRIILKLIYGYDQYDDGPDDTNNVESG